MTRYVALAVPCLWRVQGPDGWQEDVVLEHVARQVFGQTAELIGLEDRGALALAICNVLYKCGHPSKHVVGSVIKSDQGNLWVRCVRYESEDN